MRRRGKAETIGDKYSFHWKIFLEPEWRKGMRGLCERIHVHVTTVTYLSKHILVV